MGVRVIEADSASDSYDDEECPTCNTNHKSKSSNAKRSATEPTNIHLGSKDLVGNCKEYRIENNSRDLRIIGNGNRVRIANNSGSLHIIGNATRLKIQHNAGYIKYTGNDGRIYLGSDSQQQTVDYIGCNGLLKVVNSLQLHGSSSSSSKSNSKRTPRSQPKVAKDAPPQPNKAPTAPRLGVEIDNNLTIVNGIAGNIVIKNAINVSI
ncbi:hypothetical protein AWZ03_004251 [Drosophila navojoa]|uniref:Uncharacterized protein n=1 Tax=Drosophila navojoa TaxID=7232 RepID=A0A484BKT1_DRONA|nr:uncharacterized protein LOC108654030 [Drosophila navojoa]TDG49383.1 hypothetical protein AWZ03_004251 [Drosophila navojoa]